MQYDEYDDKINPCGTIELPLNNPNIAADHLHDAFGYTVLQRAEVSFFHNDNNYHFTTETKDADGNIIAGPYDEIKQGFFETVSKDGNVRTQCAPAGLYPSIDFNPAVNYFQVLKEEK